MAVGLYAEVVSVLFQIGQNNGQFFQPSIHVELK